MLSFYSKAQTVKSGVYFEDMKWIEINKSREHFDSTSVFVTSEKIYLRIGPRRQIFKINKASMMSPYIFIYECTDENYNFYRIAYSIQMDKSFHFDIGKSLKDPDEVVLVFYTWTMKNCKG